MALNDVPHKLRIDVLWSDDDIVVISKPSNLRSVPGYANSPADLSLKGADRAQAERPRLTAQQAWVRAIQKIGSLMAEMKPEADQTDGAVNECLINLASTADTSSIPRKPEVFIKYCHRNSKKLFPSFEHLHKKRKLEHSNERAPDDHVRKKRRRGKCIQNDDIPQQLRIHACKCHALILEEQLPLMNLPKQTEDWESAVGQLKLLGFGEHDSRVLDTNTKHLYVVHRLDCQTSGVMVVARRQAAASALSAAWRERESVKKFYTANVLSWPPYHEDNKREGVIDLALGPSLTERIKWVVRPAENGGKESRTVWKIRRDLGKDGVELELQPITGRTHQLRIHCATVGSGIVGDSLYGDDPVKWLGEDNGGSADAEQDTLRLHADRLMIKHPRTGEDMEFESPKSWH